MTENPMAWLGETRFTAKTRAEYTDRCARAQVADNEAAEAIHRLYAIANEPYHMAATDHSDVKGRNAAACNRALAAIQELYLAIVDYQPDTTR